MTSGMATSTAAAAPAVMGSIATYVTHTDKNAVRGTDGGISGPVEAPDATPTSSYKPNGKINGKTQR